MVYAALEQMLGNIDLLTQILKLVPAKPLITFKTVSKFWFSLISDRHFQITHTSHHLPSLLSGFYHQNYYWSDEITPTSFLGSPSSIPKIFPLQNIRQSAPKKSTQIKIVDSCNGLILCYNLKKLACSVLNPTTGENRLLPEPLSPCDVLNRPFCFLAFNPSKPSHFKVLNLMQIECNDEQQSMTISIFSSKNESCKEVRLQVPRDWRFHETRGVFWNGAINWISKENLHIRLVVEEEKFTSVHICGQGMVGYFGECGHSLYLVKFRVEGDSHFNVFEMNKDSNSWIPKFQVNIEPLLPRFPELRPPNIRVWLEYSVLSIKCETNKDNFCFVLGIPGKFISLRMNKDTNLARIKVLDEFEDYLSLKSYIDMHPFIQCLAPV